MKKLSLLLLAFCISLAGWATDNDDTPGLAYTLNPYAYDLKIKQWDESSQTLTVQFKLNAPPNLNGDEYNKVTDIEPNGIQIFAVDPQGNRYRIAGPGRDVIKTAHVNNNGQYELSIDLSTAKSVGGNNPGVDIPKNVPLTWEVQVKGRNNTATKGRKTPTLVFTDITTKNPHFYPRAAHGIAIEKNPLNPHFGKIFVADACTNHLAAAGYTYDGSSVLIYDPHLNFKDYELKSKLYGTPYDSQTGKKKELGWHTSCFSATTNYEPHRVCVSKDGRVFVSCYHPEAEDMVVELVGNDQFKSIIDADKEGNKDKSSAPVAISVAKYNRRVIAIDTKNSGDELTLLVAYLNPKGKLITQTGIATNSTSNSYWLAQVECYEYKIGKTKFNLEQSDGTKVAVFTDRQRSDVSTASDYVYRYSGLLFMACYGEWNARVHGFVDVAYDDDGDIWMKVDYGQGTDNPGRICLFKQGGSTEPDYTYEMAKHNTSSYYGANGILVTGNTLITGQSTNQLEIYTIDANKKLTNKQIISTVSGTSRGTKQWVTSLAEDFAGNIYALSEESDNIVVVAMPYDGVRRTPSPKGQTFTLSDPVPNILATDLRCDIVRGKNQYEFSFNVNTKPEEAQIRFYESYDAMKNSLNAVNADNYDGTNANKPVYVYNIPDGQLKLGRIAVKLGAVGGQADANGVITNDRLPAGVLYWSVYVKTRKSNVFAPIYIQEGTTINTGKKDDKGNPIYDYERRHIVVNNYPETDMFGALIVAHNPSVTDDATRANRGLHIYGINPEGYINDEQSNINNSTRYNKRTEYLNQNAEGRLHYPRRLAVGHDGKVYVADEGTATASRTTQGGVVHEHGGIKIWDPANPNKFALFSDNRIGTATGVALYEHNDGWKLYANNTYNEFSSHGDAYTKEAQDDLTRYGWNGFVSYTLNKYTSGHNGSWSSWGNNAAETALRRGDASGNFAFAAMDKGLWICQYREHTVDIKTSIQQPLADNFEAYILSFVPYGGDHRTWRTSESIGVKSYDKTTKEPVWDDLISPYSQTSTAPLQSTPGGGVAYKKINGKEYVYVVNHDGNIAVLEITGWTGTGISTTPIVPVNNIKILTTPEFTKVDRDVSGTSTKWHTAYITSMCFDYAGNLVTTTGKGYHDAHQDILVYTMPYDRVNAREIQAPNSCRMIPERIAQLDMTKTDLDKLIQEHGQDHPSGCAVDLYRPLQGDMFNTICLPFTLDLETLPANHPLKDATLREYTGLNLTDVGGEKVLELVFTDVANNTITANKPYIIQLKDKNGYNSIMRFAGPIQLTSTTGFYDTWFESGNNYSITYQGIIPYQRVEPQIDQMTGEKLTLMLVADNRLALMTSAGDMYGFRGYFNLNKPLQGIKARITNSKGTTTNTTIVVDGKKVNVEKFLREGRVYIRVGETLYGVDGQRVE